MFILIESQTSSDNLLKSHILIGHFPNSNKTGRYSKKFITVYKIK